MVTPKLAKILKLVLDVLKPSERLPSSELVTELADLKGTDIVDLKVEEVDKLVETVSIVIDGTDLDLQRIQEIIEKNGASLHSIDRIRAKRL